MAEEENGLCIYVGSPETYSLANLGRSKGVSVENRLLDSRAGYLPHRLVDLCCLYTSGYTLFQKVAVILIALMAALTVISIVWVSWAGRRGMMRWMKW